MRRRGCATDHVCFLSAGWVVSAHDCTTGWRTGWRGRVALPELNAFFREAIDVRRLHGGRRIDIVAPHILPAEIVGKDEDYVGLCRPVGFGDRGAEQKAGE